MSVAYLQPLTTWNYLLITKTMPLERLNQKEKNYNINILNVFILEVRHTVVNWKD